MTTSEQSKNAGDGAARRDVPTSSVSTEARVEKLGPSFNTLGRFSPVASVEEWGELFNKQEMMLKQGSMNSTDRQRGNDENRMANDEWKSVFSLDIRNSNFVIPLGDRLKAGHQLV